MNSFVPPIGSSPDTGHHRINSIYDFSDQALGELKLWLEGVGLSTPISLVRGFQQFTAQTTARIGIGAAETTSSATYTDLATVGPQLTNIPDGQYLILFGALARTSVNTFAARMSVKVNSTEALDADAVAWVVTDNVTATGFTVKTLSGGGDNTITARYRVDDAAATGIYSDRTMAAFRFANP